MKLTGVLSLLVIFLAVTSPAKSKIAMACSIKHPAQKELRCGRRNLHHANSWLRFLKLKPQAGDKESRAHLRKGAIWLRKYSLFHINNAKSRMIPAIPHLSAWLCIHRYEGSWTDSGDPFWGGLQMDRSFMTSYGSDFIRQFGGFANVWPPWAQMVAAERAWKTRGFYPWPNTARMCGLI